MSEDEYKQRPARLYGREGNLYVLKGGKRSKIKTKLKKKDAQKNIMKYMKGRMKPNSTIARAERASLTKAPIGLEALPAETAASLKRPEDSDLGRTKETDREALERLKKRLENGEKLSPEEEKRLPILIKSVGDSKRPLFEEKDKPRITFVAPNALLAVNAAQKLALQKQRAIQFTTNIKPTGIKISDLAAFTRWNGPNNTDNDALVQLAAFINVLSQATEAELKTVIDSINAGGAPAIAIYPHDDKARKVKKILYAMTPLSYNHLIGDPTMVALVLNHNLQAVADPGLVGSGKSDKKLPALYDDEIESFFADETKYPHFGGVIAADEIKSLPKKLPIGFVMNLDKSNQPGSHWVAVYINGDSVEYFDPLADPPSDQFKKDIKKYLESMHVPILMKLKINKVAQQGGSTNTCGFHTIRFLDDRFAGIPYSWSTRYENNAKEGEQKIKNEFSYI